MPEIRNDGTVEEVGHEIRKPRGLPVDDVAVQGLVEPADDSLSQQLLELHLSWEPEPALLEEDREPPQRQVPAGERSRPGREHVDHCEPSELGFGRVAAHERVKRRCDPLRPVALAGTVGTIHVVEQPFHDRVIGGEKARLLVDEQVVEGPPRHPGVVDDVLDGGLDVALFSGNDGQRLEDAPALVLDDERAREAVPAARQTRAGSRAAVRRAWHRGARRAAHSVTAVWSNPALAAAPVGP